MTQERRSDDDTSGGPHMSNVTDAAAEPARAKGNPSLRERLGALRNLPPFLREIWATSKALTATSLGLRLLRALLPIVILYVGKLIIDEAVRLVRHRRALRHPGHMPGTAACSHPCSACC
jgi:hypothetical protein